MTKEYPGLPTQEEMKKEAEQFGDSQSASIVSTIAGRREAIMLGYFWGQDNLANRAISLLEGKDLIINNLEGMLDATKKKIEEKDATMERMATRIQEMARELEEKDKEIESRKAELYAVSSDYQRLWSETQLGNIK